jgi:ubiquinone/menaquinone biosynthesis C-methylase UbiE
MSETAQISRVNRTKKEARAAYNRMSRWYDTLARSSERKFTDAGLQKLAAAEGETVLEIGFGTGHAIMALACAVGSTGRVYGIDISDEMNRITQQRVDEAGLADRVVLEQGDAAQLPFDMGLFDAIFASFTLELFDTPEIPQALAEWRRVLRAGERLCVVAMARQEKPSLAVRLYEWMHDKLPRYVDCRPIYPRQAMEDSGFRVMDTTHMVMWGLPVEIVLGEKAG